MYLAQLDKHRDELKDAQAEQVKSLHEIHGDPSVCLQIVKTGTVRSGSVRRKMKIFTGTDRYRRNPARIKLQVPRIDGYEKMN